MTSRPPDPALDAVRDRLVANLADFTRQELDEPPRRRAAVAVTVTSGPAGEPAFLLTKRSARIRTHRGQWALPGGGIDDGESVEDAALRELSEELAVELDPTAVLGRLDDYPTRSGFAISPLVVWAGPAVELEPDPREVAYVVHIPLDELDRDDSPQWVDIEGARGPVISLPLGGHNIHAPTAAIVYQFGEVALHGRPTRVAHFDEPAFAWR